MNSNHNATVQPVESPSDDRKIELSIEAGKEGEQVVLRYSTWTEGLGWCTQKTIHLDSEELDDLHRALTVARHRVKRYTNLEGQHPTPAKVIQLPTLA